MKQRLFYQNNLEMEQIETNGQNGRETRARNGTQS